MFIVGTAALASLWIQYTNRRPLTARVLGAASATLAAGLFAWLLPQSAFAVKSALAPARADLAMRLTKQSGQLPAWTAARENWVTVTIPVEISGIPEGQNHRIQTLAAQVTGPDGSRLAAAAPGSYRPSRNLVFEVSFWPYEPAARDRQWLVLHFDRRTYEWIATGGVRLTGQAGFTFYRLGETTWLPKDGRHAVSGAGLCAADTVDNPWTGAMLKVECETPSEPPLWTRVRLWNPESGSEWHERTGSSSTYYPGPRTAWLSPLHRRQCFFHIAGPLEKVRPGDRFRVPADALPTARIALTPEHATGYAILRYDLPDLILKDYVRPFVVR